MLHYVVKKHFEIYPMAFRTDFFASMLGVLHATLLVGKQHDEAFAC